MYQPRLILNEYVDLKAIGLFFRLYNFKIFAPIANNPQSLLILSQLKNADLKFVQTSDVFTTYNFIIFPFFSFDVLLK